MNEIIITPLGTVSPYPKKGMNCPGYLIEYKSDGTTETIMIGE